MKKLLILALYIALLILLKYFGLFQSMELNLYDHYWQRSPIEARDPNIVIVGIDETDLNEVNWPITNEDLVNLILKIESQNPAVVGLDIFRDLGVSGKLKQIFEESEKLVGVGMHNGVAFPKTLKARDRVGTVGVIREPNFGELRRIYLYSLADGSKDGQIPYLSLKLVWEYLKEQGELDIRADEATNYLKVNGKVIFRTEGKSGGYSLDGFAGYPYLVRWRKGNYQPEQREDRFKILTFRETMTAPDDTFTDKIVIIGYRARSIKDQFITPLGWRYGVDIVAQTTSDLLSHIQDHRPIWRFIPEGVEYGLLILMIVLAYCHYHFSRLSQVWREIVIQMALALLILGTIYGLGYLSFRLGLWIPVAQLLVAYGLSVIIFLTLKYQLKIHRANKEQEKKLKEQAEELEKLYNERAIEEKQIMLGQFATELTHDLNDQLSVITYNVEFLESIFKNPEELAVYLVRTNEDIDFFLELITPNLSENMEDFFQRINKANNKLKQSLANLRAIYQDEIPEQEIIELNSLLENCLKDLAELLRDNDIRVETELNNELKIVGNPIIIKQIINHLLNNAIDAINQKREQEELELEEGRIKVRLELANEWAKIMIQDNGIGMSSDIQKRACDPLYSTKEKGLGWGLYFAYQQILNHQGTIQIESVTNQGTKIIILIPRQKAAS
ncbi:MAG: CHASE2 domain-containing protein [Microcystaceae cyanobacterium]